MAKEDFETDGYRNGQPIYCTVNAWDCPYFDSDFCHIKDPIKNCDDFAAFFESWEDWDNS